MTSIANGGPNRGLDPAAACCRNRLEWANAHMPRCLACGRGILFTDESRFSLFRTDGGQGVRCHVGEQLADINVVARVACEGTGVCAGRHIFWTMNTGAFY